MKEGALQGIKMRELELFLQKIPGFEKPSVALEQYATPSTLAARLLWIAEHHYGDIYGKNVLDLGAGTGRLGLGAAFLGCATAFLVDIDNRPLRTAMETAKRFGLANTEIVVSDVRALPLRDITFDTVLQNPPFGVHRRGADIEFLRAASQAGNIIYTLHKASTAKFVLKKSSELGCGKATILFREKLCIPPVFFFHTKRVHCIDIVAIRLLCREI